MPRGRKPEGEMSLTNAERQARYRARHLKPEPPVVVRTRRPVERRPRAQRWHDAGTGLPALQAAYAAWLEALPETLRAAEAAEALQAILDLDLNALPPIEPPRGYG